MLMERREPLDGLPIPGPRRPSRRRVLRLTGMLWLCALGTAASGQPIQVDPTQIPVAIGDLVFEVAPAPPCPRLALAAEGEPVRAIYLDLETALFPEQDPPGRIRWRRWFCADSEAGAAPPRPAGAALRLDVQSDRPSTATAVLTARSGEAWEIGLARDDESPLEATAFASDRGGFFVNSIEWSGDGELTALDADFEVELPDGASLWGRVLWNAPWTPDEPPFVPLGEADRRKARPGEVRIGGPAPDRLFRAPSFDPLLATSVRDGERMDSILYSPDPVKDTRAARSEVAEEVARLSERRSAGDSAEAAEAPAARSTAAARATPTSPEPGAASAPVATAAAPSPAATHGGVAAAPSRDPAPGSCGAGDDALESGASGEASPCIAPVASGAAPAAGLDPAGEPPDGGGDEWTLLGQWIADWWLALRALAEQWPAAQGPAALKARP
jgi:hypothetical protein